MAVAGILAFALVLAAVVVWWRPGLLYRHLDARQKVLLAGWSPNLTGQDVLLHASEWTAVRAALFEDGIAGLGALRLMRRGFGGIAGPAERARLLDLANGAEPRRRALARELWPANGDAGLRWLNRTTTPPEHETVAANAEMLLVFGAWGYDVVTPSKFRKRQVSRAQAVMASLGTGDAAPPLAILALTGQMRMVGSDLSRLEPPFRELMERICAAVAAALGPDAAGVDGEALTAMALDHLLRSGGLPNDDAAILSRLAQAIRGGDPTAGATSGAESEPTTVVGVWAQAELAVRTGTTKRWRDLPDQQTVSADDAVDGSWPGPDRRWATMAGVLRWVTMERAADASGRAARP